MQLPREVFAHVLSGAVARGLGSAGLPGGGSPSVVNSLQYQAAYQAALQAAMQQHADCAKARSWLAQQTGQQPPGSFAAHCLCILL